MSDLVLWGSLIAILLIFAVAVMVGRKQMRSPRWRVPSDPAIKELAEELKRTNDTLAKMLQDHETRIRSLESERDGAA